MNGPARLEDEKRKTTVLTSPSELVPPKTKAADQDKKSALVKRREWILHCHDVSEEERGRRAITLWNCVEIS